MSGELTTSSQSDETLLRYSEVRAQVRSGDILLFRGRALLSRIIRKITRSPYSHAGILAWWNERLMVLEATGPGVIARPLSRVVKLYDGKVELWTTDSKLDREAVIRTAKKELGKHYASTALFRILRKIVVGIKRQPDPWRPPEKFVCSQFVSYAWRAGGIDLTDDEPDEFTTPGHIAAAKALHKIGTLWVGHDGDPNDPNEESKVNIEPPPADQDETAAESAQTRGE